MASYFWHDSNMFGTPEQLTAVGSVIAAFNLCEHSLLGLFHILISHPPEIGKKAFILLGTQSRLDLLKCAATNGLPEEVSERVHSFAHHYDICADNRNAIAHAVPLPNWDDYDPVVKVLGKFPKHTVDRMVFRAMDTAELLRIANECLETYYFGIALEGHIAGLNDGPLSKFPHLHFPLPDTPARPNTLTILHPKAQQEPQSPPQS